MRHLILALALSVVQVTAQSTRKIRVVPVVEATIPDMRRAMNEHRVTSRELVTQYLPGSPLRKAFQRCDHVNPRALEEADARDRERAARRVRGPLHGIPIALKDNIHTLDMPTTGGALAFDDFIPPYEATLTKNLRDAGAMIIAKTVLTELANWIAGEPTPMPGNYSAVGGYALNPYDPRRDPRDGRRWTAVMSPAARAPAPAPRRASGPPTSAPTRPARWSESGDADHARWDQADVGRISRTAIIPITADQDTAGPMARTVTDAAILLGTLVGAAPDPPIRPRHVATPPPRRDYTTFLKAMRLKGVRIGIPRAFYYDKRHAAGRRSAPARRPHEAAGGSRWPRRSTILRTRGRRDRRSRRHAERH